MADTSALRDIEGLTTDFLLKYKRPQEDYILYVTHACDCLREFMTYDNRGFKSEKVTVDSLGIVEMPSDMLDYGFKDICVAKNGEWWSFTERADMVNTTTTTGGVEGHDSTFGEGVALKDNVTDTLAARGAVNEYYYILDWKARRIFLDGIVSDTVLLKYISSGITLTGTTYVPIILTPVVDTYLKWQESFWLTDKVRERESLKQDYVNARLQLRGYMNKLTTSQLYDIIWGTSNQSAKR